MTTVSRPSHKHSERRQRQHVLHCRVNPDEKALIQEYAQNRGISVSSLLRLAGLGSPCEAKGKPLPRSDQELLSKLIGQLGKIGSNINQIARAANTSGHVDALALHQSLSHLEITLKHLMRLLG